MSKLIVTDAKTFEKLLLILGFSFVRKKGSHAFYRHSDGRYTTVPHHGNIDLSRPLIRQILREINLSVDEYNELMSKL